MPLWCCALLVLTAGCSTCRSIHVEEKKVAESRSVKDRKFTFTQVSHSYKDNTKTVNLKAVLEITWSLKGRLEKTKVIKYVPYNPLYELAELPEGAFDLALMPVVLLAGLCTGHYSEEYGGKGPWVRTIRPVLYKLCPVTNDCRNLLGRRKKSREVIGKEALPVDPWEETKITDLEGAKAAFVSAKSAPGNMAPVRVISAKANADGTIALVFSVGRDPDEEYMQDCRFIITLDTETGRVEVPFTCTFDNIYQEY